MFECQGGLQPLNENRAALARKRKIQEILQDKENILGTLIQLKASGIGNSAFNTSQKDSDVLYA